MTPITYLVESTIQEVKHLVFESFVNKLTTDQALVESIVAGSNLLMENDTFMVDDKLIASNRVDTVEESIELAERLITGDNQARLEVIGLVKNFLAKTIHRSDHYRHPAIKDIVQELFTKLIDNNPTGKKGKSLKYKMQSYLDKVESEKEKGVEPPTLFTYLASAIKRDFFREVGKADAGERGTSGEPTIPKWKENKAYPANARVKHNGDIYILNERYKNTVDELTGKGIALSDEDNDKAPGSDDTWILNIGGTSKNVDDLAPGEDNEFQEDIDDASFREFGYKLVTNEPFLNKLASSGDKKRTPEQYGKFVKWLIDNDLSPAKRERQDEEDGESSYLKWGKIFFPDSVPSESTWSRLKSQTISAIRKEMARKFSLDALSDEVGKKFSRKNEEDEGDIEQLEEIKAEETDKSAKEANDSDTLLHSEYKERVKARNEFKQELLSNEQFVEKAKSEGKLEDMISQIDNGQMDHKINEDFRPIDEYSEVQSEPVLSRAAKKEFGNTKQRLRDRFKKR